MGSLVADHKGKDTGCATTGEEIIMDQKRSEGKAEGLVTSGQRCRHTGAKERSKQNKRHFYLWAGPLHSILYW